MSSLSMVNTSAGISQNNENNGDGINAIFEEYANKLLEYENITEEVEWNELTASEFVTSIQTTIGNIIFFPKYMKTYYIIQMTLYVIHDIYPFSNLFLSSGYGNIVPVTFEGRLVTMIFAIISIPVNYWYIFKLGSLFAATVMTMVRRINKKLR